MKSFLQYLEESVKKNVYAIKLAIEPTDEQYKKIEEHLKKFDIIDINSPVHVSDDKMDFYNNQDKDVWLIRVVTKTPFSPYIVMQELKTALNIAEEFIVIRGGNEPVEVYQNDCEFDCEADRIADKDNLTTAARLSTDRFYNEVEEPLLVDVFGDEYNKKLLDYLRSLADDRQTDHYEAPAPLFSWIDMSKVMADNEVEADDFNKNFDTPKPVSKGNGSDTPPVDPIRLGHYGNFDDTAIQRIRLLKDKDGKREALSAPRARLKAEKVR